MICGSRSKCLFQDYFDKAQSNYREPTYKDGSQVKASDITYFDSYISLHSQSAF